MSATTENDLRDECRMRGQDKLAARDMDEQALNDRIAQFIRRYEPKDPMERINFHVDLHTLMRSNFGLACKPYEKTMSAMLNAMPISPLFKVTP